MAARRALATLSKTDCLNILGVPATATAQERRKVFLSLAKRLHPDMPTGDSERFKQLLTAYHTLQHSDDRFQPQNDMPEYDFKNQRSYKDTHARHHHTQTPFTTDHTYAPPSAPYAPPSISPPTAVLILSSVLSLCVGMGYMVYHAAKDHHLGGDLQHTYRATNAKAQEKFFVTKQFRAKRPIDF